MFGPPAQARCYCARCRVTWPCLLFAVAEGLWDADTGVWGGMTGPERQVFVRRYPKGHLPDEAFNAHVVYIRGLRSGTR